MDLDNKINSLRTLFLTELKNACSYLNRVLQTHERMSMTYSQQQFEKESISLLNKELKLIFQEKVLSTKVSEKTQHLSYAAYRDTIHHIKKAGQGLIPLFLNESNFHLFTDLINFIYHYAREVHQNLDEVTALEVTLPQTSLIESKEVESGKIPLFYLSTLKIEQLISEGQMAQLQCISTKKRENLEKILHSIYILIEEEDHAKALVAVEKGMKIEKSAELHHLKGFIYFQLGELELAKRHTLEAIKCDDDFGPAYNDLGFYLLQEGLNSEAMRWFELAKQCSDFEAKESAYIQSGRLHLLNNNYPKAMEDFNYALKLVPKNEELLKIVSRLKRQELKRKFDLPHKNSRKITLSKLMSENSSSEEGFSTDFL